MFCRFEKAGLYGQPDAGGMFEKVGHFTQVVGRPSSLRARALTINDAQIWKSTTHVGCVTRDCAAKWPDMRYFTVCDYSPAGNMIGEFAENVLPPGRSNARMLPAYPDPSQDGQ